MAGGRLPDKKISGCNTELTETEIKRWCPLVRKMEKATVDEYVEALENSNNTTVRAAVRRAYRDRFEIKVTV